tara:strand:- start:224 stop:571 length:348 start_codon:yes stop_codon:yes gene_type:complete
MACPTTPWEYNFIGAPKRDRQDVLGQDVRGGQDVLGDQPQLSENAKRLKQASEALDECTKLKAMYEELRLKWLSNVRQYVAREKEIKFLKTQLARYDTRHWREFRQWRRDNVAGF